MKSDKKKPANIDEYIAAFSPEVQAILQQVRLTIRQAAPGAKEVISFQMPAFRMKTILVYFAAWKKHIGLYPPVSGNSELENDVRPYAGPKGNVQFPLDQSIPYDLISRIVEDRVKQDVARKDILCD